MSAKPCFVAELLAAKKRRTMVSIFATESEPDSHFTGHVVDADENGVTLEHFTREGAPDGKVLLRMQDIFRVDVDGAYERVISVLARNQGKLRVRR